MPSLSIAPIRNLRESSDMKAIIDQRLAASGFMGLRASYFIYVELKISEEEKARIMARDLESYRVIGDLWDELNITKPQSPLTPTLELLGVIVAAGGLLLLVRSIFFNTLGAAGVIVTAAGVAIIILGKVIEHWQENKKRLIIKLGDILEKGCFFLEAGSAERARKLEAKLRERFEELEEEITS